MKRLLAFFLMFSQVDLGQEKLIKQLLLADSTVNLYAFVGEKISLIEFDPNKENDFSSPIKVDATTGDTIGKKGFLVLDRNFSCAYKVVQNVFNELKEDSIRFRTYDRS